MQKGLAREESKMISNVTIHLLNLLKGKPQEKIRTKENKIGALRITIIKMPPSSPNDETGNQGTSQKKINSNKNSKHLKC